jgi:hypothetical protein
MFFEVPGPLRMSVKVSKFQDPAYVKVSRFQDLSSACVKVSRFQELCVCQGFEVPRHLRTSRFGGSSTSDVRGFEVPGPLRMSFNVSRFQDPCVCQGCEVPGPPMSRFRGSRTSACQGFEVPGL